MDHDFGASLREARERKGLSLRQIATATKISVAALESLERNDFSKLPGGIFTRSFVRSYAVEVGLDPDETVQRFLEQFETDQAPPDAPVEAGASASPRPAAHGESPGRKPFALDFTPEFEFESKQHIAAVVLKLVVTSLPIAAAILYVSSGSSTPPRDIAQAPAAEESVAEQPAEAEPAPVAPVPVVPVKPPPPPQAASRASEEPITLEIAPTADCWAKLTADGAVVVSRVLKAGEQEATSFRDAAVLQVGDAEACAIRINGRPARPLGPARRVRQIRITRDNYMTFLP